MTTPAAEKASAKKPQLTPMMAQFIEIKTANPDSLLFYRMGDFYELFFEDAEIASRSLGITLTKRGKHNGEDIPMCGVPVHAADDYLQKLIAAGHRVAVCEQTEDPAEAKKRGSKAVVRRDVVRLVTPGTLTEERLLDARRHNFLLSVARLKAGSLSQNQTYGLAWVDMSTGAFRTAESDDVALAADLARIEPSEIVIADGLLQETEIRATVEGVGCAVSPVPKAYFDSATAADRLAEFYRVKTLEGFANYSRVEQAAAAGIIAYIDKTQLGERPPLDRPHKEFSSGQMLIDAATRANLELTRTLSGERRGSLLAAIDKTVTGAGSRLLASRVSGPLMDPAVIENRLQSLDYFVADTMLRGDVRQLLKEAPDMSRALSRLTVGRGGPRDMQAIAVSLANAREIAGLIASAPPIGAELSGALEALKAAPHPLADELGKAIAEEAPLLKRDGGFIAQGYNSDLDELKALRDQSRKVIAQMQADLAEELAIRSLKIKHNNVLGWFMEAPTAQCDPLKDNPERFIHRQTMAGAMRFTTTELADLESKIASAGERALAIELEIFERLSGQIQAAGVQIKAAADALALLDVTTSLAVLAEAENLSRPQVDNSLAFNVEAARHPVVEQALRKTGEPFVANSADLGPLPCGDLGQVWLITGPNMAGKSTFLRQNALIAVLAQMGSYVPAAKAHIGVVDRLFSRVGAADDLARGRSTFMVEMVETAAILNQATERSLVILDEIGRGTATFDGLSIAWAAIEHLHEVNRSRALFATHYHEITALSQKLQRLDNATVKVKEWNGEVVFLHEIIKGAADRSYGIQVAKLAGLPKKVVSRAQSILEVLESEEQAKGKTTGIDDLPLFAALEPEQMEQAASVPQDPAVTALAEAIDMLDPDDMTPKQALEALYGLKQQRSRA
ncbi:DNA mismatch repair protein MutS [Polycladidibacter hongkongensis]|uniref:DNA mismatch repair protein MutS n=1 Tax=Polycladidibacter hongkongensis TaxID=1647556 RepID=UPI00082F69FD|nr:DNA mismatch repair protein MutS [Pseudovibrio hongkongensis]